jgi:phosphoribosylglycinamide formyltransferase-1
MHSIVSLISGRGSNLEAILKTATAKSWDVRFTGVISNNPEAKGLDFARSQGISTQVLNHRDFASRDAFDEALIHEIDHYGAFIKHYEGRIINIHPSLLPRYPGLHTHERALEAGDTTHGATVHFVSAGVDEGPIICQGEVPILRDDDASRLAARVLKMEHYIYPLAVEWFINQRLQIEGNTVHIHPPESQYISFT